MIDDVLSLFHLLLLVLDVDVPPLAAGELVLLAHLPRRVVQSGRSSRKVVLLLVRVQVGLHRLLLLLLLLLWLPLVRIVVLLLLLLLLLLAVVFRGVVKANVLY